MNRNGTIYGNGRMPRGNYARSGNTAQGSCSAQTDCEWQPDHYAPVNRDMAESCGEHNFSDIPAGNQQQLLRYIDEVSFCAYDLMLYLDSHQNDGNALEYFRKYNSQRDEAIRLYEEAYGPLRFSRIGMCGPGSSQWVNQAWPWEGGEC